MGALNRAMRLTRAGALNRGNTVFEFLSGMHNQKLDFSFFELFIYNNISIFTCFNFYSDL